MRRPDRRQRGTTPPPQSTATVTQTEVLNVKEMPNIYLLVDYDTCRLFRTRLRYWTFSLYFLPFTSSVIFSPILFRTISDVVSSSSSSQTLVVLLQILLAYTSLVVLSAVFGIAVITYSALHDSGACRKTITTTSALESVLSDQSFENLLLTIASGAVQMVRFALPLSVLAAFEASQILGFQPVIRLFTVALAVIVICALIKFAFVVPGWGLAAAVSVVDKTQWWDPIEKSKEILKTTKRKKEARGVFIDSLIKMVPMVLSLISTVIRYTRHDDDDDNVTFFVLMMMLGLGGSALWALKMSYYLTSNAILYLYCTIDAQISVERPSGDFKKTDWLQELMVD